MSTPNPTPSEKHTWVAASIHTCVEPDKRGDHGVRGAWDTSCRRAAEGSTGRRGADTQDRHRRATRSGQMPSRGCARRVPGPRKAHGGARSGCRMGTSPERQHHSAHGQTCRSRMMMLRTWPPWPEVPTDVCIFPTAFKATGSRYAHGDTHGGREAQTACVLARGSAAGAHACCM